MRKCISIVKIGIDDMTYFFYQFIFNQIFFINLFFQSTCLIQIFSNLLM